MEYINVFHRWQNRYAQAAVKCSGQSLFVRCRGGTGYGVKTAWGQKGCSLHFGSEGFVLHTLRWSTHTHTDTLSIHSSHFTSSQLSWPCQCVRLWGDVAMWFRLNTLHWLIGVRAAEHVMDRRKHTKRMASVILHLHLPNAAPPLPTHTHTQRMCFLKDKYFISSGLPYLCCFSTTVSLIECACVFSLLYTVRSEALLYLSPLFVLPSIAWLVADEETLTLSPHVADEYVSMALYPISGSQHCWCMAGIFVFSEAFGLRCNLHDSAYTSRDSLINILGISRFSLPNSSIL